MTEPIRVESKPVEPSPFIDHSGETPGLEGSIPVTQMCPQWEYDWMAYWQLFKQKHGNCPVQLDDRIVFEDGWAHDAYDPGGAEYPPPTETLRLNNLMVSYYRERQRLVRREETAMLRLIEGIELLQAAKNLPLQVQTLQWVPIKDEFGQDGFSPKIGTSDMPTSHLRSRLEWLRGDILHCTTQLKTLLQEV